MVVPKRSRSTTPLQALNLLNSHFVMQQADLFAARLEKEHSTVSEQISLAWRLCFQREPSTAELKDSQKFIETGRTPAVYPRATEHKRIRFHSIRRDGPPPNVAGLSESGARTTRLWRCAQV